MTAASTASGLLLGGLVSERRVARSVAHRLKYYIDVQRKEDSFCLSGFVRDDADHLCLVSRYKHPPPAYLIKHKEKEHNFAGIKLEASLRAFIGSAEECNRKVQRSLEKQKDLEKLIKKMAQDYVPERMLEIKGKNMTRQSKPPRSLSKIHLTAVPRMSPEEVRRLISSASKLIAAATTETSPEELRTQEVKRSETKRVQSFGNGCKVFPSKLYQENEVSRGKRNQRRENEKEIKRTNEASNVSRTSLAKSKRIFSTAPWNIQRKNLASSLQITENDSGCSDMPLKMKKRESSSSKSPLRPIQMLGSKARKDGFQSSVALKDRKQQEFKGNSPNPSAKSIGDIDSHHHSTPRRKIRKKITPGFFILKRAGDTKQGQEDHREKLAKCTQSNQSQKDEWEGPDSPIEASCKCLQVSSASLGKGNQLGSDGAADSYAEKCIEKGQSGDGFLAVKQESSFLEKLCQEISQETPADFTRNISVTADGSGENSSAHSLSDQESSLNDPRDASTVEDLANSFSGQKSQLEEACVQQAIRIPPRAPAGCRCSALPSYCLCEIKEEPRMGSPERTTALLENLGSGRSKEFTLSTVPSRARSSIRLEEQMGEIRTPKENVNSTRETFLEKLLKIPEIGATQQEVSHQQEKQK